MRGRVVRSLAQCWYQHGHAKAGRHWLERAVDVVSDEAGAPLAQVAHWLGVLVQQQGENEAAIQHFERSLTIWQELGDSNQMAVELNSLGIAHRSMGDLDTA